MAETPSELAERLARLAESNTVEDPPLDGVVPEHLRRVSGPPGGAGTQEGDYVDVRFTKDRVFIDVVNDRGQPTQARWIDEGDRYLLRIRRKVTLEATGLTHRGAGDTERNAASKVNMAPGSDMRLCVDTFIAAGREGLTDFELAELTKQDKNSIAPRRVNLMQAGWVVDSKVRRPSPKGNPSKVWVLTQTARDALGID